VSKADDEADDVVETSKERPLGDTERDINPGDIVLEPVEFVEDVQVVEDDAA
jgi:hypothetical protein